MVVLEIQIFKNDKIHIEEISLQINVHYSSHTKMSNKKKNLYNTGLSLFVIN